MIMKELALSQRAAIASAPKEEKKKRRTNVVTVFFVEKKINVFCLKEYIFWRSVSYPFPCFQLFLQFLVSA